MEIIYPVYKPLLAGNEKKYVVECLDTGWISSRGVFVSKFEENFGNFIGASDPIAVSNGTVALHLALESLGVGPGDEVIVQSMTYIATVNAITYVGATPVFVDSNLDDWQMKVEGLEDVITVRTKAILVAHLYGGVGDLNELMKIAKKYDLFVVEDCAESLGSLFGGNETGTFGDVATFSFFGNKTITTGEGGMVIAKDPKVREKIRLLKGQGLSPGREYWHEVVGYNYRMTNICAAIGLAQMERMSFIQEEKLRISAHYRESLKFAQVNFQPHNPNISICEWLVSIVVPEEIRDNLRTFLTSEGIETRPFFFPVHTMPMYTKFARDLPNSEILSRSGLNLPSYPELSNADIEVIASKINTFLKSHENKSARV